MATAAQPKTGTFQPHIEAAREILHAPDFFGGPIHVPADFKWITTTDFQFSSAVQSDYPENNIVYGKLLRAGDDWHTRPTIVLIHGWNDEIGYAWRHPFQARLLHKRGLNVAMLELPYHMKRRPRTKGAVHDFLSEDLCCTVLAAKQAVNDVRSLLAWLHAQGSTRTGLLGVSLGGWLTGLVTCHEERVQFALLNVPVSRMDRVVNELPFCGLIRHSLKSAPSSGFSFEKLNLRSYRPKPRTEDILIVEAVDDLFACKDAIEEFWSAWGKPEIWRVNHAHISGLFSASLLKRQTDWIAAKAFEKNSRTSGSPLA